jgi:hypothetical protein
VTFKVSFVAATTSPSQRTAPLPSVSTRDANPQLGWREASQWPASSAGKNCNRVPAYRAIHVGAGDKAGVGGRATRANARAARPAAGAPAPAPPPPPRPHGRSEPDIAT